MPRTSLRHRAALLGLLLCTAACAGLGSRPGSDQRQLEVLASAYNSLPGQTSDQPDIAAWGDRLVPGMRSIAVSRDLLELGLGHGSVVRIDGLPGEYRVLDKMAKRWRRKIDIYMGTDVSAAREWGVREVTIRWAPTQR